MRTTDIIVTGYFSPAAIAALGLADVYGRVPLAIGQGFGSGVIALSSQDAAVDEKKNLNQTISQAIIFGFLLGIPLAFFGVLFGYSAIKLLGANNMVAKLGGQYLALIFLSAPTRHVGYVGARFLQGTGDTRTPMLINGVVNVSNIMITVILGLGVLGAPSLGIVGVGLGTAFGNLLSAVLLLVFIFKNTDVAFVYPKNIEITKQLIKISSPKIMERLSTTSAEFPFNSILLVISVEANAAWQIGRRLYQQLSAPLLRAYNVSSSVIIGQTLGEERAEDVHLEGYSIALLGLITLIPISVLVYIISPNLVEIFTSDGKTIEAGIKFTRAYAIAIPFGVLFRIFAGGLQGGGETRKPFIAEITGAFLLLVGVSYIMVNIIGYGIFGPFIAIVCYFIWRATIVGIWFSSNSWISRANNMMESRRSESM
jgi:putative MATE family efflux protein